MVRKFLLKFILAFIVVTGALVLGNAGHASAGVITLNPNPPLIYNTGPPPYGIPAFQKGELENCNGDPAPYNNTPAFWQWPGVFGANGADNTTVTFGTTSVDLNYNWASAICHAPPNPVPESRLHTRRVDVNYVNPDGTTGAPAGYVTNIDNELILNNGNNPGDYRPVVDDFQYHPPVGQVIDSNRKIRFTFYNQSINKLQFPNQPVKYGCIALPRNDAGGGWNYGNCNDEIIGLDLYIHVDPVGGGVSASCDLGPFDPAGGRNERVAIKGWAQDLDFYPTDVQVYVDKRAKGTPGAPTLADIALVGTYPANHYISSAPGYPGGSGGPPAWHDWWGVPTADVAKYADAYRHDFIINIIDKRPNGSIEQQVHLATVTIGPCALPACGAYTTTPSGIVEPGVPFNAKANFNYSPGASGLAVQNDMGLDIPNGTRVATVSNRWYAGGNSPPLDRNGNPLGAVTISNEVTANNQTLGSANIHNIHWRTQWIVPADGTLLNTLRNDHNAGGPLDYYQSGSTFYATLDCGNTQTAGNKPYFRVYGNDIAAGGGFGSSCTLSNPRATILSWIREPNGNALVSHSAPPGTPDPFMGSSSQLGAFALGEIYDFFSGGTHSPRRSSEAESPVHGLTFGNYGDPSINSVGSWDTSGNILNSNKVINYGGKGGQSTCATDYYSLHPGGTPSAPLAGTHWFLGAGSRTDYIKPTGGPAYFVGKNNLSGQKVVFVDGDAYIGPAFFDPSANTTYATPYTGAANLPSLYIIAQGNIYISPGTTDISGVFIAQKNPSTGTGGTIYTCANAAGPVDQAQVSATCGNKLTVTGAFIAENIKFMRTHGTLKDASEDELWDSNTIAETFKSSPELYIGPQQPVFRKNGAYNGYDSIRSLPPIL